MRRSGLICVAMSSRTGVDMSHILFMVEILLLTFFFFNDTATTEIYTFPTRRSSDLRANNARYRGSAGACGHHRQSGSFRGRERTQIDRKSTRLNSSHLVMSYAVFCLKKKY